MIEGGENVKKIDSEGDRALRMMYFEAAWSCRETDRLGGGGGSPRQMVVSDIPFMMGGVLVQQVSQMSLCNLLTLERGEKQNLTVSPSETHILFPESH